MQRNLKMTANVQKQSKTIERRIKGLLLYLQPAERILRLFSLRGQPCREGGIFLLKNLTLKAFSDNYFYTKK